MNTYETIYLITETLQLAGNAFMDTLSVIFALLVTGYLAGPKLTRPMIWGLVAISALFVVPMISVVQATFEKVAALAASLQKSSSRRCLIWNYTATRALSASTPDC